MKELLFTVIGGVIVAIIVSWFGIGGTKHVSVHGTPVRKTGKWIIFVSVIMILWGLSWIGQTPGGFDFDKTQTLYGLTLAGYGVIALVVGKIIIWFQRP